MFHIEKANKVTCRFLNLALVIAIGLALTSCSKERRQPSSQKTAEPVIYPHYASFLRGEHGPLVRQNGVASCERCHAQSIGILPSMAQGFCNKCHENYPHPTNWRNGNSHGANALSYGRAKCASCHGNDFNGGNSGVSCYRCHAVYPHVDPNWTTPGPSSAHATNFLFEVQAGNNNACQECHGAGYNRVLAGKSCITCHADGITHRGSWSAGGGHGLNFSTRFNSNSTNNNCMLCHGSAVVFTDDGPVTNSRDCSACHVPHSRPVRSAQNANTLSQASKCYDCHYAYPHKSYSVPVTGGAVAAGWGSVNPLGGEDRFYFGHVYYMKRHPMFVNTQQSCGGNSANMCHDQGYRSHPRVNPRHTPRCTDTCHR